MGRIAQNARIRGRSAPVISRANWLAGWSLGESWLVCGLPGTLWLDCRADGLRPHAASIPFPWSSDFSADSSQLARGWGSQKDLLFARPGRSIWKAATCGASRAWVIRPGRRFPRCRNPRRFSTAWSRTEAHDPSGRFQQIVTVVRFPSAIRVQRRAWPGTCSTRRGTCAHSRTPVALMLTRPGTRHSVAPLEAAEPVHSGMAPGAVVLSQRSLDRHDETHPQLRS